MEDYLSREQETIVRKKTGMLKTKRLLKIPILREQKPSVQSEYNSEAVQSSATLKLRKYVH